MNKPVNNFGLISAVLASIVALALPTEAMAESKCALYEPGVVTLNGQVHHAVSTWSLELAKPICIQGRVNDPYYPTIDEVKVVLFWLHKNDSPAKYAEFLNKDVVVTGTLHHQSDSNAGETMMMVSDIKLDKP